MKARSTTAAAGSPTLLDRCAGALVGLACGDAVGTAVEFRSRGHFEPLTDMRGGGPFSLEPGQWTDDTSMALCLAESLLETGRFDARDQMERYVRWWREGHWSATGACFDIGNTVRAALARFQMSGDPFAGSTDPETAGNGALMRLAPVVLFFHPVREQALHFAVESSRTTHAAGEALDCARLMAHVLFAALEGGSKEAILGASSLPLVSSKVAAIAAGTYREKSEAEIAGTGYCVASLEAALWCFHRARDFEEAVLFAANLGDDADTTAAITGQIAGACFGIDGIPERWRRRLAMQDEIEAMARRLGAAGSRTITGNS